MYCENKKCLKSTLEDPEMLKSTWSFQSISINHLQLILESESEECKGTSRVIWSKPLIVRRNTGRLYTTLGWTRGALN